MNLQSETNINELKSGLYVIATPIGNLGDITSRAIEILDKSDYILCEDTRISKKLFLKFDIKSNLISNHKFNEKKNIKKQTYKNKKNKVNKYHHFNDIIIIN